MRHSVEVGRCLVIIASPMPGARCPSLGDTRMLSDVVWPALWLPGGDGADAMSAV